MANAFSSNATNRKTPDTTTDSTTETAYNPYDETLSDIDLNNYCLDYENVLLKYHNPTYNFALYTMSASDFKLFQVNSKETVQRYVVAQSGVSARYSINDVKITSTGPGSPGKTTNSSVLQIDIDLTEQNGLNLLDDLLIMSNQLGYKKFLDVPMVLELKFVGADQDSGVYTEIPDTRKYWHVRINNITTSTSDDGATATHRLNMVCMRNVYDSPAWILKEGFECNVSTFGDFCSKLEDKLNSMAMEQYEYLTTRLPAFQDGKFFTVRVSDKLKGMQMVVDAKQDKEAGKTANLSVGNRQFRFDAKMNVSNVIDSVIDCCASYTSDGRIDPENRQFVQVVPTTTYGGYDTVRGTTVYKYEYYIVPFFTGDVKEYKDLNPGVFNTKYFVDNAPKITQAGSTYPRIQAKRYDYQFTGLNKEILTLDIKFDSQFYIATTRNPYSTIDQTNSSGTNNAQVIVFGNESFEVGPNTNLGHLYEVSSPIRTKQKEGAVLTEEEKQFLRDVDGAIASRPVMEGDDEQNNISLTPGADVYIEDYRDEFDLSNMGTDGLAGNYVNTIPTDTANVEVDSSNTITENSSPYETYRRMSKSNYYNRSFLLQLDMDVVGDPYWLGWSEDVYMNYLSSALVAENIELNAEKNTANFITSESYLLLNLKPASKISDDTGILAIQGNSVFAQTIYRVLSVTHTFSSGKFSQHINGALIIRSLRKNKDDTQ